MNHELRHGYTVADVQALARSSAANNWVSAADTSDLIHAAWSAIIDELYALDDPPARHHLQRVAKGAIWNTAKDYRRHHGYRNRDGWEGQGSAPHFAAYWRTPNEAGHEERLIERIAINEIFATLTDREQRILMACIAHEGDYVAAAEALGLKRNTYHVALTKIRKKCSALWHWPEVPHRDLKTTFNRRMHRGQVAPHGTSAAVRRHRSYRESLCEACTPVSRELERVKKAKRKAKLAEVTP